MFRSFALIAHFSLFLAKRYASFSFYVVIIQNSMYLVIIHEIDCKNVIIWTKGYIFVCVLIFSKKNNEKKLGKSESPIDEREWH